jgi:hypothetical protein
MPVITAWNYLVQNPVAIVADFINYGVKLGCVRAKPGVTPGSITPAAGVPAAVINIIRSEHAHGDHQCQDDDQKDYGYASFFHLVFLQCR